MAEPRIITYKGKIIYIADHKGSQKEEVVHNQERLLEMIKDSGSNNVLNITDMTDVFATSEVHQAMKRIGNEILKYSKKSAVVGMETSIKNFLISVFIQTCDKPMKSFNNLKDAKEWLVED